MFMMPNPCFLFCIAMCIHLSSWKIEAKTFVHLDIPSCARVGVSRNSACAIWSPRLHLVCASCSGPQASNLFYATEDQNEVGTCSWCPGSGVMESSPKMPRQSWSSYVLESPAMHVVWDAIPRTCLARTGIGGKIQETQTTGWTDGHTWFQNGPIDKWHIHHISLRKGCPCK